MGFFDEVLPVIVSQAAQQKEAQNRAQRQALEALATQTDPTIRAQGPAALGAAPPTAPNPAFTGLQEQIAGTGQGGLFGTLLGGVNKLVPGLETGGSFDAQKLNPTAPLGASEGALEAIAQATQSNRRRERQEKTQAEIERARTIGSEFPDIDAAELFARPGRARAGAEAKLGPGETLRRKREADIKLLMEAGLTRAQAIREVSGRAQKTPPKPREVKPPSPDAALKRAKIEHGVRTMKDEFGTGVVDVLPDGSVAGADVQESIFNRAQELLQGEIAGPSTDPGSAIGDPIQDEFNALINEKYGGNPTDQQLEEEYLNFLQNQGQ